MMRTQDRRFSEPDVVRIREFYIAGLYTVQQLAEQCGVSHETICDVLRGRHRYRDMSYPWLGTKFNRDRTVAWYRAGVTDPKELARRVPVPVETIRAHLIWAGLVDPDDKKALGIVSTASMTDQQVRAYREAYWAGGRSASAIAKEVGVCGATVYNMLHGRTYRKAGGPLGKPTT